MVISILEAMEDITALAANATLPKKRWLMEMPRSSDKT